MVGSDSGLGHLLLSWTNRKLAITSLLLNACNRKDLPNYYLIKYWTFQRIDMFPPLEYWTGHIWYLDPHRSRLLMLVNLDPEYLELVIIQIKPEICLSKWHYLTLNCLVSLRSSCWASRSNSVSLSSSFFSRSSLPMLISRIDQPLNLLWQS